MREFKVSAIQMKVIPNDIEKNTEKALFLLEKVKKKFNPDLVVFQETVTTGFWLNLPFNEILTLIDTIPGKQIVPVLKQARKNRVYVVWPTYEKDTKEKRIYNTAVLISPEGEVIGKYRKIHPFDGENVKKGGWVTPGKSLKVFKTKFARIGMMICYDGDFPEVARKLAKKGAEVIVRPSAFMRNFEIWKLTNRARAFDNHVFVVSPNSVGTDGKGNSYFGHSMIVSPTSNVLALAGAKEEIISAVLSPEAFKKVYEGSEEKRIFNHLKDLNF